MKTPSRSESPLILRQQFKTATRDAILDAAAFTFARHSPAHVRMEDIAARAGIAVGTLYNYFQDRSALVGALLELRTRALLDCLDAAVQADAPFRERLGRFVQALADLFEANLPLLAVMLDEERSHGRDGRAVSRRYSVLQELLTRSERLLDEGVRNGSLRKGDPNVYAALMVGMVRGLALSALSKGGVRFSDGAPEILGVFLNGCAEQGAAR